MDLLLQLRHFVVLAEEQSFGRAARRIGMAQPPLSQGIRRLEAHLGTELVDRTRRQIVLTEAGSTLLVEARMLLSAVDELPARLVPGPARSRAVLLGVPHTCSTEALTAVAGELENIRPVVLDPEQRADGLDSGELDVALVHASPHAESPDCFEHELGLAGARAALHPVDVTVPVLISHEEGGDPGTQSPVDQLRQRGLAPHLVDAPHDPLGAAVEATLQRAYWLTTEDQARRFDLPWQPVVGRAVKQRYQLQWRSRTDENSMGGPLHAALRAAWPAQPTPRPDRKAREWGLYPG